MISVHMRTANVLRWLGTTGIATIAVLRALTSFAPEVYFDVDPMHHFAALAVWSPAGSLTLDVLLLISCAAALAGESFSGRGIENKLIILALLPAAVVLWHGWHDLGDLWRGSTWLAGAIALVTVAHMAREGAMRIALLSVLLAIVGPLLVRGFGQITFEHTATVAEFEQQREQFFAQRGWEPDSPAAQIYERRLRQPQPLGWFTTTNIFGSVMATGLIVFAGLLLGALRERAKSSLASHLVVIALIIATLTGLYFTGSKGALLTGLGGLAILIAFTTTLAVSRRFIPSILIALIPLTLLGVAFRGAVLPEDFLGDRSLLFRWHYFVSSLDVFRSSPILGVGPDGFQDVYTRFRLPRNPEEVMSAHNVFIDWLCMLGFLATAWITLTLIMIRRAGQRIATNDLSSKSDGGSLVAVRNVIAFTAIFALIPAIWIEWHVLDDLHLFLRILGAFAFVAVGAVTAVGVSRCNTPILHTSIAVAVAVLVIHAQIEMTFFEPGCVVWAMCLLGAAGGALSQPNARIATRRWMAGIPTIAVIALAIWIGITGARPAGEQQSRIYEAAAMLHPPGDTLQERIHQRERAAEWLLRAYEHLPTNILPLYSAIRQYETAAADLHADARVEMLTHALAVADRAAESHRHIKSLGERAAINWQLAIATNDSHYLDASISDLRRITELDPHGIQPWQKLGDVLWLSGRQSKATEAYKHALENDAHFELDPLKRLSLKQRETIERRVNQYTNPLH